MSILDLVCRDSISFSENSSGTKINDKILLLGGRQNYISCFYFELPNYLSLKNLKSAKLILFKDPISKHRDSDIECSHEKWDCTKGNNNNHYYSVAPLLEFFSRYSAFYSVPKAYFSSKVKFYDNDGICYTEIDITKIVKDWINESVENKGLILTGHNNSRLICYASEKGDILRMSPIIRLIYQGSDCSCRFSSTPCIVEVK